MSESMHEMGRGVFSVLSSNSRTNLPTNRLIETPAALQNHAVDVRQRSDRVIFTFIEEKQIEHKQFHNVNRDCGTVTKGAATKGANVF